MVFDISFRGKAKTNAPVPIDYFLGLEHANREKPALNLVQNQIDCPAPKHEIPNRRIQLKL